MATPSEKLADSLEKLQQLQEQGIVAIKSTDLSRTHQTRLLKNGFIKNVIKGWYISSRPDEIPGDSTAWHTSFWGFCAAYLSSRYGDDWCLSPEQSLCLHAGNWTVPTQLLIRSSKGNNNLIALPHDTSLFDTRTSLPARPQITSIQNIRLYTIAAALVACSPNSFKDSAIDLKAVIASEPDASAVLKELLDGGHSLIAGRLAGAFRHCGRDRIADEIVSTMRSVGYDVRENDPFDSSTPMLLTSRERSPRITRMKVLWQEMRPVVMEVFPSPKAKISSKKKYLQQVEDVYVTDAYHSLSIEGYRVDAKLIERVRHGHWNPDNHDGDNEHRNALAARGYWQAFQAVKKSIEHVLSKENPGKVTFDDHRKWYNELFDPCVAAGILKPGDLAGYRTAQVYIRKSMHVPPNIEAVRELMPAFFELLENETDPAVRIVLGHFFFVNIHPYMDGNGRIGRFLMNVMLAAGDYAWIVVPVEKRRQYMSSLEAASVNQDIAPFARLIAGLVDDSLAGKSLPKIN